MTKNHINLNVVIICVSLVFVSSLYLDRQKDVKPYSAEVVQSSVVEDIEDFNIQLTEELELVKKEFQAIPNMQDKVLIHKLFLGSALYLYNSNYMSSTKQFDPILARVQSSYSWDRKKYYNFSKSVSDYLIAEGYNEVKVLETPQDREWLANIFAGLAEATRYE